MLDQIYKYSGTSGKLSEADITDFNGIYFMSRICIFIAVVMVTSAYVYHHAQMNIAGSGDGVRVQGAGTGAEAPQVNSIKMDLVAITP